MENELEKMVEVICQYHRYWSKAKISNLPYRKIEKEYNKIDEKKQEEKEMQKRMPMSLEDTSYTEPEVVSREDLIAMYPAGVSKKDAMGYVYDDFLGPSEPNNGKGRR